jgi:hypothetical protein
MKKILSFLLLSLFTFNCFAIDEWDKAKPADTDLWVNFPTDQQANNTALNRLLSEYIRGMNLSYVSATTVSVGAGEIACYNADKSVIKFRKNTTATNVTFADIDTGSEAPSTNYYVYAVADADTETVVFKISTSATSPTGVTYYRRIGMFYNNSSSNIESVTNESIAILTGTIAHGGTIPLPNGYSAEQCKWLVSANTLREYDTIGGTLTTREGWSYFYCSASSSRVVTCYVSDGSENNNGTANYIIIGVK